MMPRLLVVDDEPDTIQMLRLILQRYGFETIGATCGLDGLSLAQQESPDAIILDMMLPDISGDVFCKRLRNNSVVAGVPILVLSARAGVEYKEKALAAGANYYMTKPADFTELVSQLKRLISSAQSLKT